MLRFDKATYLSLLFKFILCNRLKDLVMSVKIRCFTILRIHKYSIHSIL